MDRMAKSQAARFFHSLYRTRSNGDVDRESFGPGRRAGPRCHDIGVWDPLHVWQEWGAWRRFRVLLVDGLEERKPLSLHDALVRQHPLQVRQGRLRVTVPPAPPRPPALNSHAPDCFIFRAYAKGVRRTVTLVGWVVSTLRNPSFRCDWWVGTTHATG